MARTVGATLLALDQPGDDAQVLDPAVGAGADEHGVDLDLLHRRAGLQAHIFQRALHGAAAVLARGRLGVGHARR